MTIVRMVQTSRYNWHIESPDGKVVMKSDLTFHNKSQAEDYIKRYVSSYPNWRYVLVPL